jgi:hypothetical protein
MKKAVLLIAALLMVGSFAFADFSIGCWGRTVLQLAGGLTGDSTIYQGWGPTWGVGPRLNLNTDFTSEKVEFKLTLYYGGSDISNPTATNFYGTLKFVPDLLSVIVGKVSGDGFDTFRKTSPNPNSDMNNNNIGRMDGWGIIVAVSPKDSGFDAALQLKTPDPTDTQNAYNIQDQIYNINVAASYALPDLLKISAGFQNSPGVVFPDASSDYNIWARVELLMVENLTLWVDGRFYGFGTVTAISMQYNLGFGYKMDAFGISLGANFKVPASPATNLSTAANLEVTYDLGDLTLGGIVSFGIPDFSATGMTFGIAPYINLDDFGTRIAFEFNYDTSGSGSYTWAVPVYFTFGF